MRLYYIRHAQSENNALWEAKAPDTERLEDPGLTEVGRRQADVLARHLCQNKPGRAKTTYDNQNIDGYAITHLYCSLMIRAVDTGLTVAQALGLPLHAWPDIHEEGGIYLKHPDTEELIGLPGKPRRYFETHYPQLVLPNELDESGWWNRPFEEEPQRRLRAERFLGALLEKHGNSDDHVAIISHGGFYNLFIRALLKMPQNGNIWFFLNNAAISRIDFGDDWWGISYHNKLDYIPAELIT